MRTPRQRISPQHNYVSFASIFKTFLFVFFFFQTSAAIEISATKIYLEFDWVGVNSSRIVGLDERRHLFLLRRRTTCWLCILASFAYPSTSESTVLPAVPVECVLRNIVISLACVCVCVYYEMHKSTCQWSFDMKNMLQAYILYVTSI